MSTMRRNPLSFESLEPKQLLAGDVTVSMVGGNLSVRGDDAANQIAITAGTAANSLVIQGLEGTTVTMAGSTTPAPATGLEVSGVRGIVTVNMQGGDDSVSISDVQLRRGLTVATGAGNDDVTLEHVSVGGLLNVATGAGDDTVQIGPATPAASDAAPSVKAGLAIDLLLGDGADHAVVNNASAPGAIIVGGGDGADQIAMHGVRSTALLARGGDDDAADTIDVSGAKAVAAVIGAGGGDDHVKVADAALTSLNVVLGAGNDQLSLRGVTSHVTVLAGGEGSSDEFVDGGENALGRRVVTGFEIPTDINTPAHPFPRLANLLDRLFDRLRS